VTTNGQVKRKTLKEYSIYDGNVPECVNHYTPKKHVKVLDERAVTLARTNVLGERGQKKIKKRTRQSRIQRMAEGKVTRSTSPVPDLIKKREAGRKPVAIRGGKGQRNPSTSGVEIGSSLAAQEKNMHHVGLLKLGRMITKS